MTSLLNLIRNLVQGVDRFVEDFGYVYLTGIHGADRAYDWVQDWTFPAHQRYLAYQAYADELGENRA